MVSYLDPISSETLSMHGSTGDHCIILVALLPFFAIFCVLAFYSASRQPSAAPAGILVSSEVKTIFLHFLFCALPSSSRLVFLMTWSTVLITRKRAMHLRNQTLPRVHLQVRALPSRRKPVAGAAAAIGGARRDLLHSDGTGKDHWRVQPNVRAWRLSGSADIT